MSGDASAATSRRCTWLTTCSALGEHPLWRESRAGLILYERVCGRHWDEARERGYRSDDPPMPEPVDEVP